jgi:tRNA(Ile)-lysidine synthase
VDSAALLHALVRTAPALGLYLTVAHYDHAMRAGSDQDVTAVAAMAASHQVPFVTARHAGPALRSEAEARAARHDFLAAVAADVSSPTIAYAHTADDQVETLLLNMLRGSGVGGLAGMVVREGLKFRPLLDTSRSEVEEYCRRMGIVAVEDSSNLDPRFLRNRVRHELLPLLETFNPRARHALLRLARAAREEHDVVSGLASAWLAEAEPDDRAGLRQLPSAVRMEVLRRLWADAAGEPVAWGGAARLEQVERWLRGPRRAALRDVGGGILLALDGDKFSFRRASPAGQVS